MVFVGFQHDLSTTWKSRVILRSTFVQCLSPPTVENGCLNVPGPSEYELRHSTTTIDKQRTVTFRTLPLRNTGEGVVAAAYNLDFQILLFYCYSFSCFPCLHFPSTKSPLV